MGLIIIGNGSTIGSHEIIKKIYRRIKKVIPAKLFLLERNYGPTVARKRKSYVKKVSDRVCLPFVIAPRAIREQIKRANRLIL
jgi:hypothetical protein